MGSAKIAISLEDDLLTRLDALVRKGVFPSRSRGIQLAIEEKLERLDRTRLARECALLDPAAEQAIADEGLAGDLKEWPEY